MTMAKNHRASQNVDIVKTGKKGNAVAVDLIDTFEDFEEPVDGGRLDRSARPSGQAIDHIA